MTQIKSAIRKLTGDQVFVMIKGVVASVDKNTDTCVITPIDGGADYQDVKLEALDSADGVRSDVVCYPAIGCFAIIGLIDNDHLDTFLIKASAYDSITLKVGRVDVNCKTITINGGSNGGIVNIGPLVDKVNAVENKVNSLIQSFKIHTHIGVSPGSGTSGTTPVSIPGQISPITKISDLEDTNIKH